MRGESVLSKKSPLSKSLPQGSDDPIDEHVLCI